MRVFGRALILGGLLCAFAPPADAGPILWSPDGHPECDADSNCTLFSLGALTGTATFDFDLDFTSDRDVALFEFSIDADATFAAQTSSTQFLFPQVGLFSDDPMKTIYIDPVSGPQRIASSYADGTISAELPHFSIFAVTFNAGAWTITLADAEPRTITVSATATDLIVSDGTRTETRSIATLTSLVIDGSAGDDILVIDASVVTVALQVPITFNGGGGNDTIQGPNADTVWTFTGLIAAAPAASTA